MPEQPGDGAVLTPGKDGTLWEIARAIELAEPSPSPESWGAGSAESVIDL
jgi:hypothetical protein